MLDGHTPNEVAEMSAKERFIDAKPDNGEKILEALEQFEKAEEAVRKGEQLLKESGINACLFNMNEDGTDVVICNGFDDIAETVSGEFTEEQFNGRTRGCIAYNRIRLISYY